MDYDFEFPFTPPAVCTECGVLVQNRDVHDEWHATVVTTERFGRAVKATISQGRSRA